MIRRPRSNAFSIFLMCLLSTTEVLAQTTWRRTFGGYDSNIGRSVRQTADEGYIIAGSTGSFGNGGQAYVIKVDPFGIPEWTATVGDNGAQTGMSCRVVEDGYALAGSTSMGSHGGYDIFLTRLNGSGTVLWERDYGTTEWDLCNDAEVLVDGFMLAGTTYSSGAGDVFLVRTDLEGDTLWTTSFGGSGFDEALGVTSVSNGATVVTGSMAEVDDGVNTEAFVAMVSPEGEVLWTTVFGGDSSDYFYSAVETFDGGFACSGGTKSYSNVKQVFLVKVGLDGDSLWQEEFGSMGDSEGREIQLTQNGDFAIASYNSYGNAGGKDMVLFIATSAGGFVLGKNYGGLADEDGFSVQSTADGGYITVGTAEGYGPGLRSIYVVKGDSLGETDDDTVYEMFDDSAINDSSAGSSTQVGWFPNPATTTTRLLSSIALTSAHLLDPQGRLVREWRDRVPQDLDLRGLSSGTYQLVTRTASGARSTQPLIIAAP